MKTILKAIYFLSTLNNKHSLDAIRHLKKHLFLKEELIRTKSLHYLLSCFLISSVFLFSTQKTNANNDYSRTIDSLQIILKVAKKDTNKVNILNELSSDDRIAFYSSLKGVERSTCLELLNEKNKDAVHDILGYPENSVARLINTQFATINTDITIGQASEHLRKNHKDTETANVIYVTDNEGKLIDDIPVRRFVLNEPTKKITEILDGSCVRLKLTDTK